MYHLANKNMSTESFGNLKPPIKTILVESEREAIEYWTRGRKEILYLGNYATTYD